MNDDDDLRALYAGLAMMGLLAGRNDIRLASDIARDAVEIADALLKELRSDSNAGEGRR